MNKNDHRGQSLAEKRKDHHVDHQHIEGGRKKCGKDDTHEYRVHSVGFHHI